MIHSDYLKDYDRLKQYICKNQPDHEVCGGNTTRTETNAVNVNQPTLSPTIPPPPLLSKWAWQNIVVYVACGIIGIGLIKVMGCCDKSLEQRIIEAQMRAMQPINEQEQQE